ncbi:MAG TPA: hypothetical protein VGJ11_07560 [Gaiellales bacterium]
MTAWSGEGDVPVDVLVQCVVAALAVAQDERRRPRLAGVVAAVEEPVELGGQVGRVAQLPRPAVGGLGQRRVERAAGGGDGIRQRVVEVAVRALAEAVAAHLDGRAEAAVIEASGELRALVGGEDGRCLDEAVVVQPRLQGGPVEGGDAVCDRVGHMR